MLISISNSHLKVEFKQNEWRRWYQRNSRDISEILNGNRATSFDQPVAVFARQNHVVDLGGRIVVSVVLVAKVAIIVLIAAKIVSLLLNVVVDHVDQH